MSAPWAEDAPAILLASASPRRRQLVSLLGFSVRVAPADVAEATYHLATPPLTAINVALAKARAAASSRQVEEVVLAADTVVALGERLLGKPATPEEARAMLCDLRAREHAVLTAVVLLGRDDREWVAVVSTSVRMREYADPEIDAYVARGEPFDKAGGYAVQDESFHPVQAMAGCELNVVGLPLCAAAAGLEALSISVPRKPAGFLPPCAYCRAGAELVRIG